MRWALALLALAVLVWAPRVFGQTPGCSCDMMAHNGTAMCCNGKPQTITVCKLCLGGTNVCGCKAAENSIPCGDGCPPVTTAIDCPADCYVIVGPEARQGSPVRSADSTSCQASIARLEEWAGAHPPSKQTQGLGAEARR
jgi:hypothetical protein